MGYFALPTPLFTIRCGLDFEERECQCLPDLLHNVFNVFIR
jgi:hypothetical protein